ncbi:MAG: pilus assembly protein PilP [Gammaproteobacteria bacterium]|nr:pilus assembly protein PilP [Gammaproteobacteria bacterium]
MKWAKSHGIYISIMLIGLTGCGRSESFHDLRQFLQKTDQEAIQNEKSKQPSLISQPEAVTYISQSGRTPFEETSSVSLTDTASTRNPINRYPLNLLRFVGVISQNNEVSAYILTPDDKLYSVAVGDIIGDHSGKVVRIDSNELEIVEQASEGGKPATQHIVTLQLKDAPSNAKN